MLLPEPTPEIVIDGRPWDEVLPRDGAEKDAVLPKRRAQYGRPAGPGARACKVWVPGVVDQAEDAAPATARQVSRGCDRANCLVPETDRAGLPLLARPHLEQVV